MATIVHTDWLNGMLGAPTHSVVDFDTDTIKASLLDETDAGTIDATFVDYDEVDAATVVANVADIGVSGISGGVVSLTGAITFSEVTGDAADFLTVYKDSGSPATSPLIITWDSASTGLPVTPNGADITGTWSGNTLVTLAGP
jgi:hypothetical protein